MPRKTSQNLTNLYYLRRCDYSSPILKNEKLRNVVRVKKKKKKDYDTASHG